MKKADVDEMLEAIRKAKRKRLAMIAADLNRRLNYAMRKHRIKMFVEPVRGRSRANPSNSAAERQ